MMTSQMIFELGIVTGHWNPGITNLDQAVALVSFGPHRVQSLGHVDREHSGEDIRHKIDGEFEEITEGPCASGHSTAVYNHYTMYGLPREKARPIIKQ